MGINLGPEWEGHPLDKETCIGYTIIYIGTASQGERRGTDVIPSNPVGVVRK